MLPAEYKKRIERQFTAFCMTVLYNASCSYFKAKSKQWQREIFSDYLYKQWGFEPNSKDKYFATENKATKFMISGQIVMVNSKEFANALLYLPEKRQEIISRFDSFTVTSLFLVIVPP